MSAIVEWYKSGAHISFLSKVIIIMFEGAKLLTASKSAAERYKSHAHTSVLSEVIHLIVIMCQLNANEV